MHKFIRICKKIFTKTFFIVFFLLLGLCVFFFWGWFEKQIDKGRGMYYVYKGDKCYQQHKLQKSIDYYNRGLKLYPEHYGAWFNLGNIYVVYEDYYSAVDSYQHAIEHHNKFTMARMNKGIVSAEKLGDFDEAIRQYQAIIDARKRLWFIPFIFRNTRSERVNRGIAYYNMGIAYRQKSIYLNPDDYMHRTLYLTKAIEAYKNAVKILKKDYDARYNLALAQHLLGDYPDAGKNYCKAIELTPMNYEAHYNLAILLKHLRKYKESLDELEKAAMLISYTDGNSNQSRYIFDVLNEVSRILVLNDEYKYLVENIDDGKEYHTITSVNGKIVASDALDKAMLKNFRTCRTKDYFEQND